ncbi:acyl-CoA dehydrogenase family protein [Amycolatopsis granulosa]|uniref:acyl-CoA dehydrogenase family protein n=1 Tax=Amycolatopsis granulosa TaxID=185684 RepID=UPI001420AB3C|nr:acyl-CoA dehydrogenase family protein [Amycolatopsis granulosa]NIH84738.1 glutaryl-CoA dehydrogenase [Amycolatopsis granulosa]
MTKPDPRDLLGIRDLLTDEEREIADTVRSFVRKEVTDHAGQWFEDATFPKHLVPQLGEMGLLGMHLTGYGCAGTSATAYGLACLELEAGDSGLRSFVSVQGSLAMFPIWKYGSDEQKDRWLPPMARGEAIGCFGLTEPDRGSDPGDMRTFAKRDGGDWILNGAKMWITNGTLADVAVVWARTDEGVRGFVVPTDTPGFTAREIKHKLSLRMSATAELSFDDLRLPGDAVLPGVTGLKGPLSCLSEARFGILFGALGAARACYESALDYATTREQFGRPIGGFQLTQQKLVGMALELNKGLLLAVHLGRRKDGGELPPELVSFGKLNNVRTAIDIARTARTILAANGISLEYPVLRHANNLESVLTYEGTEEIHTLVLGQLLTGQSAYR